MWILTAVMLINAKAVTKPAKELEGQLGSSPHSLLGSFLHITRACMHLNNFSFHFKF